MHCKVCTLDIGAIHVMPTGKAVIQRNSQSIVGRSLPIGFFHIPTFRVKAKLFTYSLVLLRIVLCFRVLEKAVVSDQFRELY